jgi:hypothetical protein
VRQLLPMQQWRNGSLVFLTWFFLLSSQLEVNYHPPLTFVTLFVFLASYQGLHPE